eukprot:CAMPEP_0196826062 /NCGR_PEP_ID=MMETSP1362-20130617/93417_1 /TAXON_ID=163516 /ORGANISM="Leptocylindrus danicus, Strain CCMP1856" /LENGTH=160 /DNA_ID=CAMNT_0042206593 /DNA_START=298 /DNA_END=777 /DNA_ORIENTATION=-
MREQQQTSCSKVYDFDEVDLEQSAGTSSSCWSDDESFPAAGSKDGSLSQNNSYIVTSDIRSEEHVETNPSVGKISYTKILKDFRGGARVIVQNDRYQLIILGLIIFNSFMMGLSTFDFVTKSEKVTTLFEWVDFILLITFTAEVSLNLFVYQLEFFKDSW